MSVPIKQRPSYVVKIYGKYGSHSHLKRLRIWGYYRDRKEKDMAVQEALEWARKEIKGPRFTELNVNVHASTETDYFIT